MSDTFDHEGQAWGSLEDGEDYPRYRVRQRLQCNKCGSKKVFWKQHPSGKWWMIEINEKTRKAEWHVCK